MSRTPRLGHIVVGGLLVIVGALWLTEAVSDVEVPWKIVLPMALILVGAALVYGSSTGRHGGLISLGVALTVLVLFASVFEVLFDAGLDGGVGERTYAPTGVAETEYRLAIGQMLLDLSSAQAPGEPIEVSVGVGQLSVIVAEGVAIEVRASVGIGELTVFERTSSGFGAEIDEIQPGATWVIIAEVGMGQLNVGSG
jgi:hypothetical protein